MQVAVGTSGFQYPEWRGKFYPAGLSATKMLDFYTARFGSVESNYSFRRVPSSRTISNWFEKTPAEFRFSLKAPQRITHSAKLKDCAEQVEFFWSVIQRLGDKLGAVLFQLPSALRRDDDLLEDFLRILPDGLPAAFEFRNDSWFVEEVFDLLRRNHRALCVAESENFATPQVMTAPFGYLRLRREDYSPSDLERWARWIHRQGWKHAFVYFKHEEHAAGPRFAASMQELLAKK